MLEVVVTSVLSALVSVCVVFITQRVQERSSKQLFDSRHAVLFERRLDVIERTLALAQSADAVLGSLPTTGQLEAHQAGAAESSLRDLGSMHTKVMLYLGVEPATALGTFVTMSIVHLQHRKAGTKHERPHVHALRQQLTRWADPEKPPPADAIERRTGMSPEDRRKLMEVLETDFS